ncbi:MAG: catechol 1,2-dioxygenase, partial [Bacteroidota bacterium]|nr:catechol 1,2-dioxygenase [Bacteroidota bacterium]
MIILLVIPPTTDILGPFYRPHAPLRTNINPTDYSGKLFHLSGTVFKEDGITPFPNSVVEVWQCDSNKVYDNSSDDYRYRGTQKTDAKGRYHFITCHPVPYPDDDKGEHYRPAHIHMRISGDGQQDLVTQVYFKDDPYLQKDQYSASPKALNRILLI